jgi:hypothetical protein
MFAATTRLFYFKVRWQVQQGQELFVDYNMHSGPSWCRKVTLQVSVGCLLVKWFACCDTAHCQEIVESHK